jgi:site-specific DNA-methyltransferase (adenine-specific)
LGKQLLGSLELNRIYQMDCLEGMKLIPDKSVEMILTDIPYNEVNRKSNGLRNLDKSIADILTFNLDIFLEECNRICKGNIYIFCGIEQVSHIRKTFRLSGLSTRHCIWEKSNPSPMNGQRMWLSSIENCVYAKNRNSTHNEHCKGGVWKFPVGRGKQHPTEKPLKLFEYLINSSSNGGDIILDACMGSGTTAVAALKSKRRFIGFETESKYIELSNQRIESTYNELDDEKILNKSL